MADSTNSPLALELPLSREALASLRAGDACTLSGAMYTLRDAGHMRLLDELHAKQQALDCLDCIIRKIKSGGCVCR